MKNMAMAVSLAASIALAGFAGPGLAQDFPAPDDEEALYAAAQQEGKVTWYLGMPPDVAQNIMNEFAAQYPGIEVEPVRLVSVQQFQRFSQESAAGQGIADILYLDTWSIDALAEAGFLAEWVPPNADLLPEDARNGDWAYVQAYSSGAIAYNTELVTEEEAAKLATWEGILDPVFEGRFAISNQLCSTCYAPVHMWLDPELQDSYGVEFMEKVMAQNPNVYAEINLAIDRVAAGEEDIVYCCLWGALANARYAQGAPIAWVYPSPTPVAPQSYIAVSSQAPHPNAARLFMNWWISAEGLAAQQTYFGDGGALQGVPDQMAATEEPWYQDPTETYKLDRDRWNENFASDMEIWQQIVDQGRQ